ncbi:uncharacterized protein B4U80_01777 [Leptotrombidium deliense]|uniref:Pseudouridine synthase I TruA alpha/beta domain-containing protein n=1 Tax=Leptotrombidium deliense TaxID=299467 RepID=A0A443SF61_9ACAR|nr:uncharacterized protein B4U80_01777 [Leptotrombidium deliense]
MASNGQHESSNSITKNNKKQVRVFDFKRFKKRHIALKILYLGWNYRGFVTQEDTEQTIEKFVFEALMKTKLIEDRATSNYHRCGRTDKGVSAFSQVISIDVRCNAKFGTGVITPDGYTGNDDKDDQKSELNYCKILNRVLPPDIRCTAWSPVPVGFSARFDCKLRTYKYFFPLGNLDVNRMRKAALYLVGEHDFRNICKMDVNNGVTNYMRKIIEVTIENINDENDGYQLHVLTVKGQAFLWHQVRCIVALLFLVGENKEEPEIIEKLLNVQEMPCKPQYAMAAELPLVLFNCEFDENDVKEWVHDEEAEDDLIKHMQGLWFQEVAKATIIKSMLDSLESRRKEKKIKEQTSQLTMGVKRSVYMPLLKRHVCESLEDRISKVESKKKAKLTANS